MRAIILNETGSVNNLQYVDLPKPKIKKNEVLVKTISLSINPVDYKARANDGTLSWLFGEVRPAILGWDLSGIIEEVGSEVSGFKIGDEVFGMVNFPEIGNAYAEYVAAPSSHLTLKPTNISHEEASTATLAALTALQVLNGNVKKGEKVLIIGASGGVGHYAIQIAKYFGAYVIGVSSSKNKDFVLKNGADEHIDYQTSDFENILSDIDFVFDTVAVDNIDKAISVTRKGGTIITIPSGNIPQEYLDKAKDKSINLSFILVKASGTDMNQIANLLEKGIVKSHISKTYSFDELPQAHLELETGRTVGKIAINI